MSKCLLKNEEYLFAYKVLSSVYSYPHTDMLYDIYKNISFKNRNNALNIGAGGAFFDMKISKDFQNYYVIEPNLEATKSYHKEWHIINSDFQDTNLETKFDFIVISHVLYKLDCTLNVYFDSKMYLIRC
ncbi:hypothetical protein QIW57_07185 [Francisellaceae bacterium CB52]